MTPGSGPCPACCHDQVSRIRTEGHFACWKAASSRIRPDGWLFRLSRCGERVILFHLLGPCGRLCVPCFIHLALVSREYGRCGTHLQQQSIDSISNSISDSVTASSRPVPLSDSVTFNTPVAAHVSHPLSVQERDKGCGGYCALPSVTLCAHSPVTGECNPCRPILVPCRSLSPADPCPLPLLVPCRSLYPRAPRHVT
jgi:hypothetical protein